MQKLVTVLSLLVFCGSINWLTGDDESIARRDSPNQNEEPGRNVLISDKAVVKDIVYALPMAAERRGLVPLPRRISATKGT